jgi:hypothetical protein
MVTAQVSMVSSRPLSLLAAPEITTAPALPDSGHDAAGHSGLLAGEGNIRGLAGQLPDAARRDGTALAAVASNQP